MIHTNTRAEKFAVAPFAYQLNDAFQIICQAFSNLKPLITSLKVSQSLIQAIPPTGSPLLQLPFFTPQIVQAIEGENTGHLTVQEYMTIPADKRKKISTGSGLLTAQQYQIAMATAAQFPHLKIEKAWFKVRGEKVVTPNSLVQLIIKARFVPPGATKLPPLDEKDLVHVDDDDKEEAKRFPAPLAHGPFFARDHSPAWHVFLGDTKMGRIAVPPFTYSTFDKPIVTDDGEPTYNVQTIKMQFGAPPQVGNYTFAMHIINDSYVGFDTKEYITLVVEDASKAEIIEDEGDISEPGEGKTLLPLFYLTRLTNPDTIAGQMRALRDTALAEDSDESDTEGDVADDTSETNTDTDEE